MKNSYLYSALVTAVSISMAHAGSTPPESDHEKCYGVAKAGENDCAGASPYVDNGEKQSCPGWSLKDKDPYAWSYVPKGKCLQMGGSFSPPPLSPKKPEAQK